MGAPGKPSRGARGCIRRSCAAVDSGNISPKQAVPAIASSQAAVGVLQGMPLSGIAFSWRLRTRRQHIPCRPIGAPVRRPTWEEHPSSSDSSRKRLFADPPPLVEAWQTLQKPIAPSRWPARVQAFHWKAIELASEMVTAQNQAALAAMEGAGVLRTAALHSRHRAPPFATPHGRRGHRDPMHRLAPCNASPNRCSQASSSGPSLAEVTSV